MVKYRLIVFFLLCSNAFPMELYKKFNKKDNLATSIGEFSFSLFETINKANTNVVYSPFSIASSLLTISYGSTENTKSEIQNVLKLDYSKKNIKADYDSLYKDLFVAEKSCELILSNMVFIDIYSQVLESFEDSVISDFHAKIEKGTFAQNKNNQIDKINRYFSTGTDFDLKDILSPTTILDDTKLLLINTLFMTGTWKSPFNTYESEQSSFLNNSQNEITTYKMRQTSQLLYHENSDFQIVSLPIDCKNNSADINFLVILPKNKMNFQWKNFRQVLSELSYTYVDINLPRFALNQNYSLKGSLEKLGMKQAFTRLADFSKINGRLDLYLNDVIHGCVLKINESGINMKDNDRQPTEHKTDKNAGAVSIDVNRPFYFVICDLNSKTVLFIGTVQRLDIRI